jgi:glycosyltransferase involved in cell wall biosynthesis
MGKDNIAIILLNVGSLAGGGGAERQFASVFEGYTKKSGNRFNLFFITDTRSWKNYREAGLLGSGGNLVLLRTIKGAPLSLNSLFWGLQLIAKIRLHKLRIVHVGLLGKFYAVPFTLLGLLPRKKRPLLTVNIVDCTLAHWLRGEEVPDSGCNKEAHKWILEKFRIDGLFVWYELFKEVAGKTLDFPGKVLIRAARYCFADTSKYHPAHGKKNEIVFAARMVSVKNPLLLVEAVRTVKETRPELLEGWHFSMYGKGPLEEEVITRIKKYGLGSHISLSFSLDMAKVFAESKAFVSTQDLENFTSLSMIEAMAAGNAIIARNVGQTHYFVRAGQNGILAKEDSPESFGRAIAGYLENAAQHEKMSAESVKLATEVHTLDNFITDIEDFWEDCIRSHKNQNS